MKVVVFVPVRGDSTSIPNKNMQIFCGEPLYLYTVRKLLACSFIDEVYVDSEKISILNQAKSIGAQTIKREKKYASKKTDGHRLLFNEANCIDADIYVQILCTSPFIEPETIKRAIEILKNDSTKDSVVLMQKMRNYKWQNDRPAYGEGTIPNRDDIEEEIVETMGMYVCRKAVALDMQKRFGDHTAFLFAKPIETVPINTIEDLELAKYIAAGIRADEANYLRLIRTVLSSPVISDVADELGLNTVLAPEYSCNLPGAKILGRARTLKIRTATKSDSQDAIYKALESYKVIANNDIVVVATEQPKLAYFGEINMSLAIRTGASGAIISGVTRDVSRTHAAQFPVFSKGRYCKDIKGKGAVAGINIPLIVDGVALNFGDLIFADDDGIVVIPRTHEKTILHKAIQTVTSEAKIISDILQNVDIHTLVEKHGHF